MLLRNTVLKVSVALGLISGMAQAGTQATANGTAIAEVVANLQILAGNNLNFGLANPGDTAKTVSPTDPGAGEFLVTGEPNKAYNITLPADGTVVLKKGSGGSAQTEIPLYTFTSNPPVSGTLAANGQQSVKVGASRNALDPLQEGGLYVATYTVTVAY